MKSFHSKLRRLLGLVRKIPGGLMLVPMAISAFIYTFLPAVSELGSPFKSVFSSSGTMSIVGIMLVFAGIQTKPREMLRALKKSGVLLAAKLALNILLCVIFMRVFGVGGIWEISAVAFTAALTACNPGVYIALMEEYGDAGDRAGFALLNLAGLPFVPVFILEITSGGTIDYMSIVSMLLPFLIGMLFGVLEPKIRDFTKNGTAVMLPFLGVCLGSSMDLRLAFSSVGKGLVLYLTVMICNLVPLYIVERCVLKKDGRVAAAICCVAGLSLTVPEMMAEGRAEYAEYVDASLSEIGFCVILSAIVTPALVRFIAGRHDKHTTPTDTERTENNILNERTAD